MKLIMYQNPFMKIKKQYIDKLDIQKVVNALKSELITTGPFVDELEKNFKNISILNMYWHARVEQLHCIWL